MSDPLKNLHVLPKVRDSLSYLYVEHGRIDQEAKAVALHDANGTTPIPCAALTTLMLGPGTAITHAAVRVLAASGCLVFWTGEESVRFYAQGLGETRSARNLLRQARLWAAPASHLAVVRRMYELRFPDPLDPGLTLQQIRGKEGIRVREAYAQASRATGVEWHGRSYQRGDWRQADPVNRALSAANSTLYGICQAAIVSAGYSTALGFIHTGKMLSFVYDVADFYKADVTIPAAFEAAAEGGDQLERRVRYRCRDHFQQHRLLQRIVGDLDRVLWNPDLDAATDAATDAALDVDEAKPGGLWDPSGNEVAGGVNFADDATSGGPA